MTSIVSFGVSKLNVNPKEIDAICLKMLKPIITLRDSFSLWSNTLHTNRITINVMIIQRDKRILVS